MPDLLKEAVRDRANCLLDGKSHIKLLEAGCDLVMGNTGSFASTSQNNMERAGMRIAYTRVTMVDRTGV